MSGNNKRRLNSSFAEDDEIDTKFLKCDDGQSSSGGGGRSSRPRKKSAKVLEMEEFEVELSSSTSKTIRSRRKSGKSQESEAVEIGATKSPKNPTKARKKSPVAAPQPVDGLLAAYQDIKEEIHDSNQASALKLMLSLPVQTDTPTPQTAPKPKAKGKSNSKKSKKIQKQQQTTPDVGFSSSDEVKSPNLNFKEDDDLPDEEPPLNTQTSGRKDRTFGKDITQKMVVAEKVKKKRATPKKKKLEQLQKQALAMQPALLNFEPDAKVETMEYEAFVQTIEEEKKVEEDMKEPTEEVVQTKQEVEQPEQEVEQPLEEEEEVEEEDLGEEGEESPLTTTAPAKIKRKKKISQMGPKGKALKGKGRKKDEKEDKTPKRRTTAYTLWCNNTRKELMAQYPSLDFAQISKKLAELWQTVSVAEKNSLKKKARKIQKKQNNGQEVSTKELPASTHMRSGQPQPIRKVSESPSNTEQHTVYNALPVAYNFKVTGNAPIDVAAHLKLLGESLGTIGARLQEHRGHIAVQGSLSVLLDSLICALGPLMCLTNQVPELNSVPNQIHQETLDNIAYIMPGIG